jgi:hypothetical protein
MDGGAISVEVFRGVATLNGTARSTAERMHAGLNAYGSGALFVDNRIRVRGVD